MKPYGKDSRSQLTSWDQFEVGASNAANGIDFSQSVPDGNVNYMMVPNGSRR